MELGNNNFNAFGLTRVEVNIKKINSKNMISVRDAILNVDRILFLDFRLMRQVLVKGQ